MADAKQVLEQVDDCCCNLIFSFHKGGCDLLGEIINTSEGFIAERQPWYADRRQARYLTDEFPGDDGYYECMAALGGKGFKVWTPPNSDAIHGDDRPQLIREIRIASLQRFLDENSL